MPGADHGQDNLISFSPRKFLHSVLFFSITFSSLIAQTKFGCKISLAETVYSYVYSILLRNAVIVVEHKEI